MANETLNNFIESAHSSISFTLEQELNQHFDEAELSRDFDEF